VPLKSAVRDSPLWKYSLAVNHWAVKSTTNNTQQEQVLILNFKSHLTLVVVMMAVNLWKALQLHPVSRFSPVVFRWKNVKISEILRRNSLPRT
jgi:hypothetical protein